MADIRLSTRALLHKARVYPRAAYQKGMIYKFLFKDGHCKGQSPAQVFVLAQLQLCFQNNPLGFRIKNPFSRLYPK